METQFSDIHLVQNTSNLNSATSTAIISNKLQNPASTSAIIISQLFTKLKHLEGVFDLFLNGDKLQLPQGDPLLKQNSLIEPVFKSFIPNNNIPNIKSNPEVLEAFKPPVKKTIIKDVFFTLPQDSHEVNISNLVSQQNSQAQTPAFINSSYSDRIFEDENLTTDADSWFYDQVEQVSDPPKKAEPYQKALESEFGDMFITNSYRNYEKDDETTSQSTACEDSDWDEYDTSTLDYFPVSCTKPKNKTMSSSTSTPMCFSDNINDLKDQDINLSSLCSSNSDHGEHVAGDITPRSYSPLAPNLPTFSAPLNNRNTTIFQEFTKNGVDWCRYCGTTEGINWRPGPWGRRTLCNKHGCDYKGYGFASKTPRLDLRSFIGESIGDRRMPILQSYCYVCLSNKEEHDDPLYYCSGCPNSYHKNCLASLNYTDTAFVPEFFCRYTCLESFKKKRIVIELQKRKLPFMCSQTALYKSEAVKPNATIPVVDLKNTYSRKRCTNLEGNDKIKKRKSSRS